MADIINPDNKTNVSGRFRAIFRNYGPRVPTSRFHFIPATAAPLFFIVKNDLLVACP